MTSNNESNGYNYYNQQQQQPHHHSPHQQITRNGHSSTVLKVERPYYEQEQLNDELKYSKPIDEFCRPKWNIGPKQCLFSILPILGWMSQYKIQRDLTGDIVSGCTVAVMHIPQGMGYALLANVPPVVGIYTAFFPVLFYFIFGTSRHNSMGTFAVISIMVGKAVTTFSNVQQVTIETMRNDTFQGDWIVEAHQPSYTPIQVASTVCFLVGVIQLVMYVFRLGIISTLLSETLVSGFTTGAAIHVFTSQVDDLLGVELKPIGGLLKIIYIYIEIVKEIILGNVNYAAIIISTITIIVLFVNNLYLKPKLAKKCFIPVPIEMIAVLSGLAISKIFDLEENYQTRLIGDIPKGFPEPEMPKFELLSDLIADGFIIAMVSYTISVSMALIFAQKLNYEIDFNQELFALGGGNIIGSFFSCLPVSASLSRSNIQFNVGGKSQIASIVSCSLLAIVLIWIAPFFETLPRCILASIIVVALKDLLLQVKQFFTFWRLSRLDAVVWLATFLTVILVAIDIGLAVGIGLSLACIFIRGMKPYTCLLGHVAKTDLYLDIKRYKSAEEINFIKIFHYCGSLNFASRGSFKTELCKLIELNLVKETRKRAKLSDPEQQRYEPLSLKCLIIDFTALSYIDPSGCTALRLLINDLNKISIIVYIAGCSCPTYEMMKKCDLTESPNGMFKFFPTVHDAVHQALEKISPISVITST